MSWVRSTKKALYLMDNDSYLDKVEYQVDNTGDLKSDLPLSWFNQNEPPKTLVIELNGSAEPAPINESSNSSSPSKISAQRYAFLDLIAYAEGTDQNINGQRDGYNIMFSFKTFSNFADHPRQIITANGYSSSAAGRYQFIDHT